MPENEKFKSGRFETDTHTVLNTKDGSILKITHNNGTTQKNEFRTRPHCMICGKHTDCLCFMTENSDIPYEDAIDSIKRGWLCGEDECLIEYEKREYPESYEELIERHNGNLKEVANSISHSLPEMEEGEFCEI